MESHVQEFILVLLLMVGVRPEDGWGAGGGDDVSAGFTGVEAQVRLGFHHQWLI